MGLKTEGKGGRTIEYKAGTVRVFNGACFDTVTRPGIETYLTLGFGGSGQDLVKAWDVTDQGPETMGGVKVEKLHLVPKDASVKANFTMVDLWVDLDRDVTVKQVFTAPQKDTYTAVFSGIETKKRPDVGKYSIPNKPCSKK